MKIFTIGFTRTSAESFFTRLVQAGVRKVMDVRLSNVSQLAGFAKKDDLRYFLEALAGIGYEHAPELAPTPDLFDSFKKRGGAWEAFEPAFLDLMAERRIDRTLDRASVDRACLLCSEAEAYHCHRRLVAEYLREHWGDVEILHL